MILPETPIFIAMRHKLVTFVSMDINWPILLSLEEKVYAYMMVQR